MESVELRKLDLGYNSAELLIDKLNALQRWGLEPLDLLLRENFEGDLRDEEIGTERASISDRCL